MNQTLWLIAAIVMGIAALAAAAVMYKRIVAESAGNDRSKQVAGWIEEGAESYLKRLYTALIIVAGVLSIVIAVAFGSQGGEKGGLMHGIEMAVCFVVGAAFAAIAGYIGMAIAVKANVRTAVAAQKGLVPAFRLSFNAGTVMGLATVGVAVIGMAVIYWIFGDPSYVLGFSFGASTLALLAKAGGGIFTKTADIAADLVGKVEVGIPEDDPRNPAVIADNVGDNVGDVAGTGADIFDSYVASTVAAMLLGASMFSEPMYAFLPLVVCVIGVAASLIGVQFVRVKEDGKPGTALNMGTILTCVFLAVGMAIVVALTAIPWAILFATLIGLITGVLIGFVSDYYTSDEHKPVLETARVSGSGSAVNIITGFSYGLVSVIPSVIGIVVATLASYFVTEALMPGAGIYGIGIAAVGMLSVSGMIVSSDAYGPIVDNARGIAEMAGMEEEVIVTCDKLDAAGNTAKAITKGFSISAAALTVLAIFHAYGEEVVAASATLTKLNMDLADPLIIAGVFLGAIAPPLFSALLMLSVTRNAFDMIEEVRGQFRDDPGILAGTSLPNYAKCVGMAAQGALRSLIGPAFIAIGAPLAVGLLLGPEALGAFLGGAIITGVILALLMTNAGGLWDNAKKFVETGQYGGKGSEAHKAAVVGDTVGDPFKDTAGPSLNTLITVMSLAASFFAPVIAALSLIK